MKTYTVRAKRWARGWELHIDGVGVTQSHGLADADMMARSYIAMETDTAPDSFTISIAPEVGGGLDEDLTAARDAQRAAEEAQRTAAQKYRTVARKLHEKGMSGRDISAVLGVSAQRVSQLLKSKVDVNTDVTGMFRVDPKTVTRWAKAGRKVKQTGAERIKAS